MKTKLLLLAFTLGLTMQAQTYELTLIQNNGYNYSVAAIPDFTTNVSHPYINDQNFTITIPDGVSISGVTGGYSVPMFTAIDAFNPGENAIPFNLVEDIVLPAHTVGVPIILTTFDVDGAPTSGAITLLDNTSGLVTAAPSVFGAFFIGALSGDLADGATDNYVGQTGTNTYNFATLGTVENELTVYSIFPNPATDIVTIKGLKNDLKSVEIYNITGQKVMTYTSNLETINVSDYANGIYLIMLESKTGRIETKRLVKQ